MELHTRRTLFTLQGIMSIIQVRMPSHPGVTSLVLEDALFTLLNPVAIRHNIIAQDHGLHQQQQLMESEVPLIVTSVLTLQK